VGQIKEDIKEDKEDNNVPTDDYYHSMNYDADPYIDMTGDSQTMPAPFSQMSQVR